mmetsp:Transcript_35693/g.88975  ORF Transcript_35693/g.88975 Transcript_35693/m.88975 type:complete len:308 (+) Transcript_35693:349-1272(+)
MARARSATRAAAGETRPSAPSTTRGPAVLASTMRATEAKTNMVRSCTTNPGSKKEGMNPSSSRATMKPTSANIQRGMRDLGERESCACCALRKEERASRMRFCNSPTLVSSATRVSAGNPPSAGTTESNSRYLRAASCAAEQSEFTSSLRCHTRGRPASSFAKSVSKRLRIFSCTCSASARAARTTAALDSAASSASAPSICLLATRSMRRSAESSCEAFAKAEARPFARRAHRSTGAAFMSARARGSMRAARAAFASTTVASAASRLAFASSRSSRARRAVSPAASAPEKSQPPSAPGAASFAMAA